MFGQLIRLITVYKLKKNFAWKNDRLLQVELESGRPCLKNDFQNLKAL